MPRSLGGRLLLGAAVVVVVALALTGVAIDLALRRFIQAQVDGRVDGQLAFVEDTLRTSPDGRLLLERSVDGPPFDRRASGWYWEVLAPGPVLTSRSLGDDAIEVGPARRAGPRGGPRTADGSGPSGEPLRVRLREVEVDGRAVTIVATAPLKALRGPRRDAMTPLACILAALAAALLAGVVVQVRVGLPPLGRLQGELARVREGREARIPGPQPREVRPLVDELDLLLDENTANLERARRNVANLAHGLKTPLATLAIAVEEGDEDARRRLRPLVDRMGRLIRHHLARARTTALGGAARTRVELADAVADHLAALAKIQADERLAMLASVGPGLGVAVDAQDLDERLGNLLDDAGKWARGRVVVFAEGRGQRVDVSIEDDGPGVPEDRMAEVTLPGRRIDEATPGHGFGLPIVRELAEPYGGSSRLSPSALGGLKATVDLPGAA